MESVGPSAFDPDDAMSNDGDSESKLIVANLERRAMKTQLFLSSNAFFSSVFHAFPCYCSNGFISDGGASCFKI